MSDKKATREGYAAAIGALVAENENIVVFDADLSGSTKSASAKKAAPERFFNAGIAENNMTGMAAGMAACGYTAFISTFAVFGTGRNYDFIRSAVCYPNLNVKLALTHAGLTVGEDGATHQMLEDIALMNALPNMKVFVPADYNETIAAIRCAAETPGPVYIRMGREPLGLIYGENATFAPGKVEKLTDGDDCCIFACGIMVEKALAASEELKSEGIFARVVNVSSIKPLNKEAVIKNTAECGCAVTCEEHSIYGGLNSVISQVLCENGSYPLCHVAVEDTFGTSAPAAEVLARYGLSVENIKNAVKRAVGKK